ncbi:MAG: flagellar basal body rod protein FlgB, partial [Natronospirillum sp.]
IHPTALTTRANRSEVLANNLSNADTPGFKARDFDFQAVLRGEVDQRRSVAVNRTDEHHLAGRASAENALDYRVPHQPSIDGNTVDPHYEHAQFTQNALSYNATFEFLNSKFNGLRNVLRGE